MTDAVTTQSGVEVAAAAVSDARVSELGVEVAVATATPAVVTETGVEVAATAPAAARVSSVGVEVAIRRPQAAFRVQIAWDPAITTYPDLWAQDYADVTERVIFCEVTRSAGLPDIGPDQVRLRLENNDLRYTPGNTASPLYGRLSVNPFDGRPVRVLGIWNGVSYPLFFGYLSEREVELSQTVTGRTMDFVARSPMERLAPATIPGSTVAVNIIPEAADHAFNDSYVRLLLSSANYALQTGTLGRPEVTDGRVFAGVLGGDTSNDVDESAIFQFGPFGTFSAAMQGLSMATGGMYYIVPRLQASPDDTPYYFRWQALSTTEDAADDFTVVDADGDLEQPRYRERAPAGLA